MPASLLLINADAVTAYRHEKGHLYEEGLFEATGSGLTTFTSYIERNKTRVFHLLADTSDEDFRIATIPHVRGRDRQALLDRKRNQSFYGTPYSTASFINRASAGRRDDLVLFAALTARECIDPWLAACTRAQLKVAGLYSPPLLLEQHARALGLGDGLRLLLSIGRSGFRQTCLSDGRLLFSRLLPLPPGTPEETANTCCQEIPKLIHHLRGQSIIPQEQPIRVTVVSNTRDHACWRHQCVENDLVHYEFADLSQLAQGIGFTPAPTSTCDALLLRLLARRNPPSAQFAPPEARRFHRLGKLRHTLLGTGVGILALALLLSTFLLVETFKLKSTGQALEYANQQEVSRLATIAQPLPPHHAELRTLVHRFHLLQSRSRSPLAAMQALSRAMTDTPEVDLDRLEWRADEEGTTITDIEARLSMAPASAPPAMATALEKFARLLQKGDSSKAALLRTPYDAESAKTLRGGADEQVLLSPTFSLRLTQAAH